MPSFRRRGFTLIELMIVIVVIAILASMILATLSILKRLSRVAQTKAAMADISLALSTYFDAWPVLGDAGDATASDFTKDPWSYLFKRGHSVNKQFIDLSVTRLVKMTGVGTCSPADAQQTATHIIDFFGNYPSNVFEFKIANGPVGGGAGGVAKYTRDIMFRSSAGTPNQKSDDLILHWTSDTSKWNPVKASDFPLPPDPGAPSTSQDPNVATLDDFNVTTVLPGP